MMTPTEYVAANIRLCRQGSFTQKELAEATGIERSIISKIESGIRPATIDELVLFAKAFCTPPGYLLGVMHVARSTSRSGSGENVPIAWPPTPYINSTNAQLLEQHIVGGG